MKILIPDIPKDGISIDIQETLYTDSVPVTVLGRLNVEKAGGEVLVKGSLEAEAMLQCSRCLKTFRGDISISIDVCYHPVEELTGGDCHEVTSEELDLDFYAGEELDIMNLLSEQVALNLPMKPLCNDICRGICPNCGTDLNISGCSCSPDNIDPRFQKLKKLLKEGKE
jgi:uncharacterized protein